MTAEGTTTIKKLMELFHESRSKGEWVNLSMESKDGKDSFTLYIEHPSGGPAGQARTWATGSRPPWTWRQPRPWTPQRKRKSPSQWKRDQKRQQDFLDKKAAKSFASADEKEKVDIAKKVTVVDLVDEINLTKIPASVQEEVESDLFKIIGEYRDPNFKPFSVVEPEKELKVLWEKIKTENEAKGIKEIGEGSTCFEHFYEFWGTWKVEKPRRNILEFLKSSENWPKGIKILEVNPD